MFLLIWLIIIVLILALSVKKSMRQKKDFQKKKAAGQIRTSSSSYRRRSEAPKEDILTRSIRNASGKSARADTLSSPNPSSAPSAKETAPDADFSETSHYLSPSDTYRPKTEFSGLMDTVQDLIVKGYEPKLSFERDFVSEGMNFLNSYYDKQNGK